MQNNKEPVYEFDYVYLPHNSQEFENVHIKFSIGSDKMLMEVRSKIAVTESDLSEIFAGIKNNTLKRLKINYKEDCDVFYYLNETQYRVDFNDENIKLINV